MKFKVIDHLVCRVCDVKFKTATERNRHIIKDEHLSLKEYILKYFLDGIEPTCKCSSECNIPTGYNFRKNYIIISDYTTNHFPRTPHTQATKDKIRQRTGDALEMKYGVRNVYLLPTLKKKLVEKIKQTKKDRYGNENYNNIDKNKQTKKELYGNENYNNIDQIIKTNMINYGGKTFMTSPSGFIHTRKIKKERYGDENYNNMDKNKQTKMERYGYETEFSDKAYRKQYNGKTSQIEIHVATELNAEHKFIFENKEFDMKLNFDVFEVDGDYHHQDVLCDLAFPQISTAINDKQKNDIIDNSEYNLYRVHVSNLPGNITSDTMKQCAYAPDYSVSYYQKIMTKLRFTNYIDSKGIDKLVRYIPLLLKFIRTFQPEFPILPQTEILSEIIQKINNYDLDMVIKDTNFQNNSSLIGINYLKSSFKSYWNSSFKNKKTPVEVWQDNDEMKKVIAYRIGCNNSGEISDFSLHQLVRGISAKRYTVSFFKPILATAIYNYYLTNKIDPIVLDPCAGFGGRMLGFISKFQTGTYIGIEPNVETFSELVKLKTELITELDLHDNQIQLYNCKLEDYVQDQEYDLIFTSIPYYNTEIYSDKVTYKTFELWETEFISSLLNLRGIKIINMSNDICTQLKLTDYIDSYIISNASHFAKENKKSEVIINIS